MKVSGIIGQIGLSEWWLKELTKEEQKHIVDKFGADLIKGRLTVHTQPQAVFLADLSSWVNTKNEYPIALKLIKKAENEFDESLPASDKHFYYMHLIRFYYKNREKGGCLDAAIKYCNKQIAISKTAKVYFQKNEYCSSLPSHTGFEQLSILEEKLKNYSAAIALSKQAKEEGWAGEWDKRIERCIKKMTKK